MNLQSPSNLLANMRKHSVALKKLVENNPVLPTPVAGPATGSPPPSGAG